MKNVMMAVAGLAMAVVLTGCGGSPKGVAEKFVDAVIQRDTDKAVKCYDTNDKSVSDVKALKEKLEKYGKDVINDDKLEACAIREVINVPAENSGYTLINGKKLTGEDATVTVQFVKGKDKKSEGMRIMLLKIDGSWKVTKYSPLDHLDTADK